MQFDPETQHPKLIGFSGLKGAGKDTAGKAFTDRGYTLLKFAGPMKIMLSALLRTRGAPEDRIERMLDGDLKEARSKWLDLATPRHALQTLGTEWGRNLIDSNFWVNTVRDAIHQEFSHGNKVVVTDVRFHNEVNLIQCLGGRVVRINGRGEAGDLHPSEAEIPHLNVDMELTNDYDTAAQFTLAVNRMFFP